MTGAAFSYRNRGRRVGLGVLALNSTFRIKRVKFEKFETFPFTGTAQIPKPFCVSDVRRFYFKLRIDLTYINQNQNQIPSRG